MLGVDFTAQMAAAQAAAEQASHTHWTAAAADPGVGTAAVMPDPPTSPNYGSGLNPDIPRAPIPVAGEGFAHPPAPAPNQSDHGRPSYAAPVVGDEDPFLGQP